MKALVIFLLSVMTTLGQSVELRGLSIEGGVEIGAAAPVALACSTTDTTNAHALLVEGFQGASFFETNWTVSGVIASTNYDISGVFFDTNQTAGSCDKAIFIEANNNTNWIRYTHGVAVDNNATNIDITFYLFVASSNLNANANVPLMFIQEDLTPPASAYAGSVLMDVTGGLPRFQAVGSASSATIVGLADAWNRIKLHLDSTEASSYINVNGTQQSFTCYDRDLDVLFIGNCLISTPSSDIANLWFDVITWDISPP